MAKVTFTGSWRKIHSCCCHGMRINSLTDFEERLFWRLNLVADDYGVFHADPRIVRGACIPLLDRPVKDVQDALDNLEKSGLIWIFCSQECQYLRICDFERFQSAPNGKRVHRFIEPAEINSLRNPEKSRKIQNNPNTTDQNRTGIDTEQIEASASCTELPAASVPEAPAVMSFPCVGTGGKTWRLTAAKLDEWKTSYPGVDVHGELLKARQWLADNPRRQKTNSGMARYLGSWLSRAQNDGKPSGVAGTIRPEPYDLQKTVERALSTPSPFFTPAMIERSHANGKA